MLRLPNGVLIRFRPASVGTPNAATKDNGECGLKTDRAKRLKELEKENQRLRRAVSDLTLDKLILAEAAKGNF